MIRRHRPPGRSRGFTMIELLIVLAIVGILVAVAYPSMQDSMRKSRRANARALLMEIATLQERYFTLNNTYADTFAKLGYSTTPVTVDKAYTASLVPPGGGGTASMSYRASLNTGFTDPACGNLTLDNSGQRTASGTLGSACW